ncbi:porin family protein [Daejeonella lutea]|uniref:Outer membrane protein transport protein (OMPP1/FadL/TodX) n=1 Tax=Daejeonella lutea TaxID=572036 RepID=A0A1T5D3C6_9SPHI|nr:outer membrane protein transport protein [Daejeonella lutea]SKB66258.1 Outer membrane protein transport protein (OMPP1/FadL/TodX) [Daejeonella lutea]
MIKIFKNIFFVTILAASVSAAAQTTSSSPYSQFGLGDLKGSLLPQTRGMGGISMGIRKPGVYDNINMANPASYSTLSLTAFEVGASMDLRSLSKAGVTGKSQFNSTLSHINFGIPVNRTSAISFGLVPYSDLGYQFKNTGVLDTNDVEYVYGGEGGVSKAYAGYGFKIGKNLSLGFNIGYLFGSLKENRSIDFLDSKQEGGYDVTTLNSRTQFQHSIGGFSFDIGLQYEANISDKTKLILGYASNTGNKINSRNDIVTTRYRRNLKGDDQGVIDSTYYLKGGKTKINMPLTHTVGFAFENNNSWLFGADVSYGKWSDYSEGSVNGGLNNSLGVAVGGQVTPDASSINNYWKLVDYRLGMKYDRTFINIGGNDIKQYGLTFGFGFPLPSSRSSFYRINLSTEIGKRGTEKNNLVSDKYVNVHLGFTLNDKWFQKTYIE